MQQVGDIGRHLPALLRIAIRPRIIQFALCYKRS
jgi:hypothetical protein